MIGRARPPGLLCMLAPYIRDTRKEAEDFFRHFAVDHADEEAIDNYVGVRSANAATPQLQGLRRGAAAGGLPVIGTPEDIVDTLVQIHRQGYAGATFTLPNFLVDLPVVIERVLPLLQQAGLR